MIVVKTQNYWFVLPDLSPFNVLSSSLPHPSLPTIPLFAKFACMVLRLFPVPSFLALHSLTLLPVLPHSFILPVCVLVLSIFPPCAIPLPCLPLSLLLSIIHFLSRFFLFLSILLLFSLSFPLFFFFLSDLLFVVVFSNVPILLRFFSMRYSLHVALSGKANRETFILYKLSCLKSTYVLVLTVFRERFFHTTESRATDLIASQQRTIQNEHTLTKIIPFTFTAEINRR